MIGEISQQGNIRFAGGRGESWGEKGSIQPRVVHHEFAGQALFASSLARLGLNPLDLENMWSQSLLFPFRVIRDPIVKPGRPVSSTGEKKRRLFPDGHRGGSCVGREPWGAGFTALINHGASSLLHFRSSPFRHISARIVLMGRAKK